ncbi:MAG: UDP-N-acetylmuramoyl-L-alanine--D-glutamate ligase [Myxococcales bacterium]
MTTVELAGSKVLVVGLGKSGVAAARLLLSRGARVVLNDRRSLGELDAAVRELSQQGAELALGHHDEALFTAVDRIVVSPGVPPLPALDAAERAGVPVVSEIELASAFIEGTLVGITGTNGKSTVTSLVGEMCQRSGRPTFVGGNLGTPLIDVVGTDAAGPGGVTVVELSSFQLERVDRLRVNAAALLNVTDDHLDRYPSFQAYAEAKGHIFDNQTPEDAAVVPDGDVLCEQLAGRGRGRLLRFGGAKGEARVEGDALHDLGSGLSVPAAEVGLAGRHNLDNACAAMLLAREAGVEVGVVAAALRGFRGLPHRMQRVRTLDGVHYLDDSKATNVGAAAAALDGLSGGDGKVVLIAGGKDKGGSYAPLVERLRRVGRAAVLVGEAAPLIAAALKGEPLPVARADSLEAAVAHARELARPGDTVLLSPACASFDMFRSYAHRGEVFQRAVQALTERGESWD